MSENQQSYIARIDSKYTAEQRELIGDDIVEFIKRRTRSGVDKNNKPFKGYSKAYVDSLDFKLGNKRRERVDLTLSGDMLIDLTVLRHGPGFITVGFEQGTDENDKAKWNADKGREILGLMPKDLESILSNYPLPREDLTREQVARSFAAEFVRQLFNR